MIVYVIVGKRRTLHKAAREGGGLMSLEADNLDATNRVVPEYTDEAIARAAAKRICRRCFPDG